MLAAHLSIAMLLVSDDHVQYYTRFILASRQRDFILENFASQTEDIGFQNEQDCKVGFGPGNRASLSVCVE